MDFELSNYSIERLKFYLSTYSEGASDLILEKKLHLGYFESYFKKFDTKVILVEKKYIDKDYLEDFSFYYVSSFFPYKRYCTRLHFFTKDMVKQDLIDLLQGNPSNVDEKILRDSYLGFIVIKPLPQTIIGRTCLKTYPFENKRFYPIIREYPVNLFGLHLSILSIAFQEQDSVVAACASSAIWSAFNATGSLFQHSIPSPAAISKAATQFFPFLNRHFPNDGLTPEQMAHAIRNVGLEPFLFNANENDIIRAVTYAYLKAKIPIVLGFQLNNSRTNDSLNHHAVTITGYSLEGITKNFHGEPYLLSSSRMKQLYVHDDQIGPFARMEFLDGKKLSTSWKVENLGITDNVYATPEILIIPLYHKIRIPLYTILHIFLGFNKLLRKISSGSGVLIPNIEWDIFLSTVNDFKTEIINSPKIKGQYRADILTKNLPRFLWRVIGSVGDEKVEFVFDATDIEQGNLLLDIIIYSNYLFLTLKNITSHFDTSMINSHWIRNLFNKINSTSNP